MIRFRTGLSVVVLVVAGLVVMGLGCSAGVSDSEDAERDVGVTGATVASAPITATSGVAGRLEEVARSGSFGLAPLWDLEADSAGAVWAAIGGMGIFRYDETMAETLALTDLDGPACCGRERVEVDASGTVYAIAAMAGPDVDGHGEAELVPVLTRVSLSGEEQIVRSFDQAPLSGVFEISGTDAITAFGVHVAVVDLDTGALQAEAELDGGAISMALTDDVIWIATTSRAVLALNRETLEILDRRDGSDHFKQLVSIDDAVWGLVGGEVIAISDSALAVPVSAADFLGQQASDGRLWLLTREALIVFSGDDGVEIARAELESGHIPGSLEVSGRTAWLEDGTTHEIVRYELSL